jgi:carbon-monoxide dehydrogenase large subunit
MLADYAGFKARDEAAKRKGRIRGIGIATYVEACAFPGNEPATVTLNGDGTATLLIGTQTGGQGHDTAYSQFIAERLGLDYDKIIMIGRHRRRAAGQGGRFSLDSDQAVSVIRRHQAGGTAKSPAAKKLEAAGDLGWPTGVRRRRTVRSLVELAKGAKKELLTAVGDFHQPEPTYPNGTHIAEVEIDPETGATDITGYWVVDDFGASVNPMLLAGQVHGGIVQGLGQALWEHTVYDADGQLLTASFLDSTGGFHAVDLRTAIFPPRPMRSGSRGPGRLAPSARRPQ